MKKIGMRITTAFFAAAMALTAATVPAAASPASPEYSVQTIDTSKKGSLTIHKIVNNSGGEQTASGLEGQTLPAGSSAQAGASFSYLKAGEFMQKVSGSNVTTYITSLNASLNSLITTNHYALSPVIIDGENCYNPDDVRNVLKSMNESMEPQVRTMVQQNGTAAAPTDSNGTSVLENLNLGLYLVAETESAAAPVPSTPFLAMLPMTNLVSTTFSGVTYEPGKLWQYDVSVYPKSQSIGIRTEILNADETAAASKKDVQIGDALKYRVTADVPMLGTGDDKPTNRKYVIQNQLGAGITYNDTLIVTYGPTPETAAILNRDVDYLLTLPADPDRTLIISLTEDGLAKLDAVSQESHIYVKFSAVCNRNAEVGAETNASTPTLIYTTSRTAEKTIAGTPANVYTYQLDMTKQYSLPVADYSQAEFKVTKDGNAVTFVRDADGSYHVSDGMEASGEKTQIVRPAAANGKLSLKGFNASTLEITEMKAASGYSLLKSSFSVSMTATSPAGMGLQSASISQGGKTSNAAGSLDTGHVAFTVTSTVGISLPHTGGNGTALYTGAGIACLAAAAALFIMVSTMKKRKGLR